MQQHHRDPMSPSRRRIESLVEAGLVSGVVSAVVTAGLLALAGIAAGVGPVVPFYAIVAIVDPLPLHMAQDELAQGVDVSFFQPQFVGGLGVCLILGAVSGVVFALGLRRHEVNGWVRYVVGGIHGVLMMCLFYLGAVRSVAVLAGIEADAMSLSNIVGWPALIAIHAVHGVVLAWVLRTRLASTENVFADAMHPDRD
jgi:hypothetical protein